jgi:hypothetical protein
VEGKNMAAVYTIKNSGIMFKPDMIIAYLEKRKNQTRRTKNLQIINEDPDAWDLLFTPLDPGTRFVSFGHKKDRANIKHIKMPYGGIGDHLYFKETWRAFEAPSGDDFIQYRADNEVISPVKFGWDTTKRDDWDYLVGKFDKWQSSMFMPLKVARIRNVPILNVRVERLQDLTEADAKNEGVLNIEAKDRQPPLAIRHYIDLWNSINGETLPWSKNPWVWVYDFPLYQK